MRRTTPVEPCPPPAVLELLAHGNSELGVAAHVEACTSCRVWVEEIRENDQFLAEAAPALRADAASGYGFAGDELSEFEDVRELRRGGQGIVYRAFHRSTGRYVAIKERLHGSMATSRQRARFEREIAIAARLDHPNIVTLYGTCTAPGGRAGYVMEYVDGEPLDEWTPASDRDARPHVRVRELLEVFCKICGAIAYAHERGVIHRDLKPQNILLDSLGEPHVLDFGLARSLEGQDHTVTVTGEVMGTFAYAAPEQLTGDSDQIDTRTDVYALGVLAYTMLTGEHPYPVGGSMADVIRQVTTARPAPARRHNPGIDSELETILQKALAKEPERRYAYAGALLDDVRRYLVGDIIDAKRDSRGYLLRKAIRRHRVGASVAAAFVMLITVFAVVVALEARKLEDQLTATSIEQGRALATSGNVPLAEGLLWGELLPRAGAAATLHAALDDDRHARAAYWALWELYSVHPCQWSVATRHGPVTSLAITTDGARVATGHREGVVALRDGGTGQLVMRLRAHSVAVTAVAFDRGGALIAAGGADGSIYVWRLSTGELALSLCAGPAPVRSLAFAPGGELLSADGLGGARRWDLTTGLCTVVVPGTGRLGLVEPSGAWHASASQMGIDLGDWEGGVTEIPLSTSHSEHFAKLDFAASGDRVAALRDYRGSVFELPSGRLLSTITEGYPEWLAIAGATSRCATVGRDRRIRIWELAAGPAPVGTKILSGHRAIPYLMEFGGVEPELLVAAESAGTIKCWQIENAMLSSVATELASAHAVAYGPEGRYLALAGASGRIEVVDGASGQRLAAVNVDTSVVSAVVFDRSGDRLVTADYSGAVRVWDWRTPYPQLCFHHGSRLAALALSADGSRAFTAGDDRLVRVWDMHDGRCLHVLSGHGDRVPALALHPDEQVLVSASKDGTVRLWEVEGGRPLGVLETCPHAIRTLAFSPDGELLASGNDDWSICLWNVERRELVATLEGQTCELFALAFHPDGNLLASGGRASEVRLWDVRSHRCLATVETGLANVFGLAFDPSGGSLAISGARGAQLLDLDAGARRIAGNLELQLDRLESAGEVVRGAASLRHWARQGLAPAGDRPR